MGVFQTGGFPDLDLSFLFCPSWDFPEFSGIVPVCSGMDRGFSRFFLLLSLGPLRAPTRNSPKRVRDTFWTFPEKSGRPPGLETARLSFSQDWRIGWIDWSPSQSITCRRVSSPSTPWTAGEQEVETPTSSERKMNSSFSMFQARPTRDLSGSKCLEEFNWS